IVSMIMVAIALSLKWGQFGVLAVAGLGIMYIASTAATLISAFAVRAFDDRVRRGRGAIDREMSPTVVDAGDAVEERFVLARVPESIPFAPSRVRLVLDTYLPPGWRVAAHAGGRKLRDGERAVARAPEVLDDVLDLLVEGWIGLAHTLLKRGEAVSLVTAVK